MKYMTFCVFLAICGAVPASADEDITNRIQEMRKFGDQQQQTNQREQYQQYLRNNDSANGVSQRTGPTGSVTKGGGTVGYQWSTK